MTHAPNALEEPLIVHHRCCLLSSGPPPPPLHTPHVVRTVDSLLLLSAIFDAGWYRATVAMGLDDLPDSVMQLIAQFVENPRMRCAPLIPALPGPTTVMWSKVLADKSLRRGAVIHDAQLVLIRMQSTSRVDLYATSSTTYVHS